MNNYTIGEMLEVFQKITMMNDLSNRDVAVLKSQAIDSRKNKDGSEDFVFIRGARVSLNGNKVVKTSDLSLYLINWENARKASAEK